MTYNITYSDNPLSGDSYYDEFVRNLDSKTSGMLSKGIRKLKMGNFGNCERIRSCCDGNVGNMSEIKIDYGCGYRIYYTKISNDEFRILNCGTKNNQKKDIGKARNILSCL